jgi:hypothetical protein
MPEMRTSLLDDVSHATRRRARGNRSPGRPCCCNGRNGSNETRSRIIPGRPAMHTSPIDDDEDEVLEDEQFDEDAETDDDEDEDGDDDEEEEETWQVAAS